MLSTLAPGQEIERCQLFVAPPEGLNVRVDEVRFTAGSHHVLLFRTPYQEIPAQTLQGVPPASKNCEGSGRVATTRPLREAGVMPRRRLLALVAWAPLAITCSGAQLDDRPAGSDLASVPLFQDAGAPSEECLDEGKDGVGDAGPGCCEGLVRTPLYKGSLIRLDECQLMPGDGYRCVRCGDGRCGLGENACNCPADCR